ncbi:MAG TPA: ABC transporter permease subunit, partial [Candidatus Baltobacteraceae bacterium]|nr:ABC transporter permease subunit [Candidatus Baltobacteraceae bacterium]
MTERLSIGWLVFIVAACVVGPFVLHLDPRAPDVAHAYAAPFGRHLLGTDGLGRDELARLLAGGRISLLVGSVAALVAMLIGTSYGALSAYYGGWIDILAMRIVDVFMSVPTLFLLLFLAALFHGSLLTLILVIGVTAWLGPARLVRGEVLTLK